MGIHFKSWSKTAGEWGKEAKASCSLLTMFNLDEGTRWIHCCSPHFRECLKICMIKNKKEEKSTWQKVLILRVSMCMSLMA